MPDNQRHPGSAADPPRPIEHCAEHKQNRQQAHWRRRERLGKDFRDALTDRPPAATSIGTSMDHVGTWVRALDDERLLVLELCAAAENLRQRYEDERDRDKRQINVEPGRDGETAARLEPPPHRD